LDVKLDVKLIDDLKLIGFTDYEAKIYIALVKKNPLTGSEVSRLSRVPTSKVYTNLEKLVQKNVVSLILGDSVQYVPLDPFELITRYKQSMLSSLERVEKELLTIKDCRETDQFLWNIQDYDVFIQKAKDMITRAEESLWVVLWSSELNKLSHHITQTVQEKNISIRIMSDQQNHALETYLFTHFPLFKQGSVSRPMIVISDESEVLIGLSEDNCHAIWSTNPVLLEMALTHIKHEYAIYQLAQKIGEEEMKRYDTH
jgi:HTH-type transcriptional regulator, sugar sensing transcriptional regulator